MEQRENRGWPRFAPSEFIESGIPGAFFENTVTKFAPPPGNVGFDDRSKMVAQRCVDKVEGVAGFLDTPLCGFCPSPRPPANLVTC